MSEKFEDLLQSFKEQREKPDEEDLRLWKEIKKGIKPLKKRRRKILEHDHRSSKEKKVSVSSSHTEEAFDFPYEGEFRNLDVSSKTIPKGSRQERRLRRRATPEATLDLHGLTQKEAHKELCHFVRQAHFHGFKTLRVITGKGGPLLPKPYFYESDSEKRREKGVLKRALPSWLGVPPLSSYVSHFTPARTNDGGEGAWYLFLKSSA